MLLGLDKMLGLSGTALLADENADFWFPTQASSYAEEIDSVFNMITYIDLAFFVAIVIAMIYFMVKYTKRAGEPAESRVQHHTLLEVSWSVLPCFLLVYMFYRGTMGYLDMQLPPAGAYEVNVTAKKWAWNFRYPGGDGRPQINNPELHTVVGRPTKLVMRSDDVIHSCFIPAFRMKRDIVPGRYNIAWFQATEASERVSEEVLQKALDEAKESEGGFDPQKVGFTRDGYKFFDMYCAEYCGTGHSEMDALVVVHESVEDLERWLAAANVKPDDMSMEEYGQLIYDQRGCKGCHTLDGSKGTGPSFQALFGSTHALAGGGSVTVDENYIRESILQPKAKIVAGYPPVMPSFQGQLTDQQIDALIAFIKTLN